MVLPQILWRSIIFITGVVVQFSYHIKNKVVFVWPGVAHTLIRVKLKCIPCNNRSRSLPNFIQIGRHLGAWRPKTRFRKTGFRPPCSQMSTDVFDSLYRMASAWWAYRQKHALYDVSFVVRAMKRFQAMDQKAAETTADTTLVSYHQNTIT